MRRQKLRLSSICGASALLLASASAVHAGVAAYTQSFDSSASFTNNEVNGGPAGTNWYDGFNPTPINIRFDYGSATATANHSVTWSSNNSPDPANGALGSGSVKLGWLWNTTADGDGSAAFTMDIQNTAGVYTSIGFDMYIDPSSTHGQFANDGATVVAGTSTPYPNSSGFEDYGFFQVFTKDQTYNQNEAHAGPDSGSLGDVVGTDPVTGAAETSYGAGVWEHFQVNLTGTGKNVRGITFQSFSQGESGPQAILLDNITLNVVPEPASLGMLAVAGSSVLLRRRRQA
jgi:hypothetical protein